MADNIIATWQDVEDKGYIVSSSDDLSQCPTKQKLLNANVTLSSEANSYSDTRLIPYSFIKTLTSLMIQGVSDEYSYGPNNIIIDNEYINGRWDPRSWGAYPSVTQIEAVAYLSDGTDSQRYQTNESTLSLFYPNDVSISLLSGYAQWYFSREVGYLGKFTEAHICAEYRVQFEGSSNTALKGLSSEFSIFPGSSIEINIEIYFDTMMGSRPVLISLKPFYTSCRCVSRSSAYSLRPSLENQEENIPEPIFVKEEDGKIYYKFSDYEENNSVEIPEILMEQEPEIYEYNDPSSGVKITVKVRHMPEYQNIES